MRGQKPSPRFWFHAKRLGGVDQHQRPPDLRFEDDSVGGFQTVLRRQDSA